MKSRSFLILVIVTAIAVGGAGASVWKRQNNVNIPDQPDTLFPGLMAKINQVAALSVVTPTNSFKIEKGDDGVWRVPEKSGYPVKFETVKQAVVGIISLKPMAAKTAKTEKYASLNVDDPTNGGGGKVISIFDAEGNNLSALTIGTTKSTASDTRLGWYYVRRPDEDRSWLVEGRLDTWEDVTRWLDSSLPTIARTRIWSVSSGEDTESAVTVSRKNPGQDNFEVDNIPEGRKVLHSTSPNALGSAMGFLSFEDVQAKTDIEGWDKAHQTTFRTFDGLIIAVKLNSVSKDETWASFDFSMDIEATNGLEIPEDQMKNLKSSEEVTKEVSDYQARYAGWAYRLPDYKNKDFLSVLTDITAVDKSKE